MASFWKPEACGQTVLPDKTVLVGKKLVENDKIQKFKCDILSNFQTMCECVKISLFHWFPRLKLFLPITQKGCQTRHQGYNDLPYLPDKG